MVDDELEPLITRCPNCRTQFRVTESQLAVASGRVRCGACLTVFQGIDHLVLDQESPYHTGTEADAALDELLDELEPGARRTADATADVQPPPGPGPLPGSAADLEEKTRLFGGFEDLALTGEQKAISPEARVFRDVGDRVTEDRAAEAGITDAEASAEVVRPEASADETLEDDLAEVDASDAAKPAAGVPPSHVPPSDVPPSDVPPSKVPSSDVDDAGDVTESGTPEGESEPGVSIELDQPAELPDASDADYERWLDRNTETIDQLVEEVVASGRAAVQRVPAPAAPATASVAAPASSETAEAGDTEAAPRSGGGISFAREPRRWWAGVLAGVFILLLLLQIAYLQLPEWSREPGLRGAYEWACGWLGCELPEMRALDALRTRNLVVRSHPDTAGALIVDAAIVNLAPYPQRYPDLELRFTSVNGELVAGRRFRPDEYLPDDFEGEQLMPPDTPIQVSLEIVDPGPDAVNYTLSFR